MVMTSDAETLSQDEFEFNDVRMNIFIYCVYFLLARALVIAGSHFWIGRSELAWSSVISYPIPCFLVIYFLKRENAAKVIPAFLVYFFTLGLNHRLECEPLFLPAYFLLPGKVALAFLTTEVRIAALLSAYAALTVIAPSLIVHYFHPYPILYLSDDLLNSLLTNFVASTAMVSVASYVHSKRMKRFTERLRSINSDYRHLLSTVLHDFANDLQIGRMSFDALKAARDPQAKVRNEERLKRSLEHLSEMVHALRVTKDRLREQSEAPTSSPLLSDVLKRAEQVFEEPIAKKSLKIKADWHTLEGISVKVEPTSFSLHVFNNIFGNAVKFAEENSTLIIEAELKNRYVVFSVTNIISLQHPPKGTGMGLRIAKNLCEKAGIKLSTLNHPPTWISTLEIPLS